jgi:molybdenum cofactor cytidylyltransferase
MRRIGVILAAGRGRRFGGTKQLAMWTGADGPKPLVAAAYDAIRPVCREMIVVVGHDADAVAAALGDREFRRVDCIPNLPMFESIRVGLRAARVIDSEATVVVQPGDQPEVARETLDRLIDWSLKQPVRAVIPQVGERGGHPVLIPARIAEILIEAECPDGLGDYWLAHPEHCVRIAVDDPSAVRDIDTRDDIS